MSRKMSTEIVVIVVYKKKLYTNATKKLQKEHEYNEGQKQKRFNVQLETISSNIYVYRESEDKKSQKMLSLRSRVERVRGFEAPI